jgi:arabinan endo-1,5-alpha-L-arabinosidase
MKKAFIPSILLLVSISGCGDQNSSLDSTPLSSEETSITSESTDYQNPVWEPVLADPSIIRADDGTFYVYGTQDNAEWGDYFGTRYIPILSSTNLVEWEAAGAVFKAATAPTWGTLGAGLWAPDIVKIGDTYTRYYSLSTWGDDNPGIGVATAPEPLGPWTDHGKLLDSTSSNVANSIDPTVYVDNGRVFMMWGSFCGIYAIELSADGLTIKDNADPKTRVLIAGVDGGPWNASSYEGAYVRKINEYYYLFLSTGTCCAGFSSTYRVMVARADNILGPYVDHTGVVMTNRLSGGKNVVDANERFVGVGHNALITDDAGDYWMLYHGYDLQENPQYGTTNRRALLIDKLLWDENDWPYVQDYGASTNNTRPVII